MKRLLLALAILSTTFTAYSQKNLQFIGGLSVTQRGTVGLGIPNNFGTLTTGPMGHAIIGFGNGWHGSAGFEKSFDLYAYGNAEYDLTFNNFSLRLLKDFEVADALSLVPFLGLNLRNYSAPEVDLSGFQKITIVGVGTQLNYYFSSRVGFSFEIELPDLAGETQNLEIEGSEFESALENAHNDGSPVSMVGYQPPNLRFSLGLIFAITQNNDL